MNAITRQARFRGVPVVGILLVVVVGGLVAACGVGGWQKGEPQDIGGRDASDCVDRIAAWDGRAGADLTDVGLADGRQREQSDGSDVHQEMNSPDVPDLLDLCEVNLDVELEPWDVEEDYWVPEPPEAGCTWGFPASLGGVECAGGAGGACPVGFQAVDSACRPAGCVENPDSCCTTPVTVVATNTPSSQCKGRYLEVPQDDGGICVPSGVGPLEGLFRSENQGGCYSVVACPTEMLWRHPGFEAPKWAEAPVAFSPLDPQVVLAAAGSRVLLSHDGGSRSST